MPKRNRYAVLLTIITGFAGILYGLGGAALAVALPYIKGAYNFTPSQLSMLVAGCMLGAVISSAGAGSLADYLGRRKAMLIAAAVFGAGYLLAGFFGSIAYSLMLGLIVFAGMGMGILGVVVPMYIAECTAASARGKTTAVFQLVLIVGAVLTGIAGIILAYLVGPADSAAMTQADFIVGWRSILFAVSVPAILLALLIGLLKESPRWLYRKGRKEEALASLAANNGEEAAKVILAEMIDADAQAAAAKAAERARVKDSVFQRKYLVPFLIAFTVLVCNQTTGINAVLGFSVMIFKDAGLSGVIVNYADTLFKIAMLIATILACVLVDTKGRKFLLKLGTSGIILSMTAAGVAFLGIRYGWWISGEVNGWFITICLTLFITSFSIGPGVCVWLALTELMPNRIRAVGMSVALFANQGVSFGLEALMLPMKEAVGYGWIFLGFALCTIVYFVTAAFFMPETKGRTLEEIEAYFADRNK